MNSKDIGEFVKFMRKKLEMSQSKMGNFIGIHQTAFCRVEKGFQDLTATQFMKLMTLFKSKRPKLPLNTTWIAICEWMSPIDILDMQNILDLQKLHQSELESQAEDSSRTIRKQKKRLKK